MAEQGSILSKEKQIRLQEKENVEAEKKENVLANLPAFSMVHSRGWFVIASRAPRDSVLWETDTQVLHKLRYLALTTYLSRY